MTFCAFPLSGAPRSGFNTARIARGMDAGILMERIARGDLAAFEALYDRYARLVYGVALRILKNETAAEDLTQSVFMKTFTAPTAYRAGNFTGWISRVTRNCALDMLRKRDSQTADLSAFAFAASDEPVEDTVIANIDAQRARAIMSQLPDEQRTSLELAFFEGMSHNEIAASTGTPLGTVKTRIRSGLTTIRKALETRVAS